MTRRCFAASFSKLALAAGVFGGLKAHAAGSLSPVDEAGFRRVVAEHRGKVLLVDFWATWCAPCREELPKLVALYGAYRAKGLDFITVSCDEAEQEVQAAAFIATQRAPKPHYIRRAKDDDVFINSIDRKWSGALPALFLFDRTGQQAASFVGETDMKQLEGALNKMLAR